MSALAATIVLSTATGAYAYCGDTHLWAGGQATWLFRQGIDLNDPSCITADHGGWPLYPELLVASWGWNPWASYTHEPDESRAWYQCNWEYIRDCSKAADSACVATLNHFWLLSDGLKDENLDAHNSWEVSNPLWLEALRAWNEGDLGWAYENLGYCMHHVQDMLQPAHSNADLHAGDGMDSGDDSLEEWFLDIDTDLPSGTGAIAMYSWDGTGGPRPGPEVPYPNAAAQDNHQILQDILNAIPLAADEIGDFPELANPDLQFNLQKYFYLLYWANQVGSWFASDDVDGQAYDPCNWLGGYPGFPRTFPSGYDIYNSAGLNNNDSGCDECSPRCRKDECDGDQDLTMIAQWCYAGIFKASPALIDLFRRTVDANPPVTTTEVTRADGEPVVEWNNSPVTVALTDATDGANPCFRPSGVWKIWGLCDGNPPADYDNPSWLISGDGKHKVECRSADMCGNIEHGNNIDVWVDMTPPEITFPALRPNYLTSEDFTATWVAFDATSGVASEIAYLDGQLVTNGQVFDLALMAGPHTLRVIAADNATNWSDVTYGFEVWIDTATFAKPVTVNTRTHGEAMMVDVEFPAPYEVGAMDLSTCRLRVGATIDLHETFPVMGGNVTIEGTLLGGIADTDKDGRPERAIKFDKGQFAEAVAGQTGDIRAVVWGGLLPDGTPRFIGAVTIPVFTKGMASR